MPGIVGLVTKRPRQWAEPQLMRMIQALRHESFYVTGTHIDESLGVYAGWVLKKDSFVDCMPIHGERKNVTLLFSGEEFPQPETGSLLKQRGHHVCADGRASYLVHVYEEDASFPATLNGRFHGLVIDRDRQSIMLFNDRYSMHRICHHEASDAFYFAPEAKAILTVRPELRRVNWQSMGEFLACACVFENRTVFDGIFLVPPGSAWLFRNGELQQKRSYFQPEEWETQTPLDAADYYCALRDVFTRNLPRYFTGDQPIGVSLTGGLDMRMIMANQRSPRQSLRCYTFGGPYRDCQDVLIARKVARACDQPHEVIPVTRDFLSHFSHYAERAVYIGDGCVQVDRGADLYANEHARQIAPVRITGNYGSEVLRWAPAFKPWRLTTTVFQPELGAAIERTKATYATTVSTHPVTFAVFRQAPWYHYGLLSLEESQLTVRTPYLDNDLVRTVFRAHDPVMSKRDRSNIDLCLRIIANGSPALRKIRTDRGLGGDEGWVSAAAHLFQELTFKAEYVYDYGMPPWVSRVNKALSGLHPERLFLGRHKFTHYRTWYQYPLAGYVRQILLDPLTLSRPYIDRRELERLVHAHLTGARNYTYELHKLLTLELIHRAFFDRALSS